MVPYDVLIDYESLPDHPIYNKRETMQEVLNSNVKHDKQKEKEKEKVQKIKDINHVTLKPFDQC